MATAEEVLQTMAEVPESAPVCVIDPETRTIIVPPEYQLFGVENDKRTERLYFQCPKIVGDNQDLSQNYQLFMNYQNANGDPDAYHIEDMEVEGDNITFSWLLEENVTKYRGNIQFAFGAIIPGDETEDPDKNRWNTTINTECTCLVGLKCTQQVSESNPDALVQIWAAIDELKAGGGTGGTTNYNNLSNKPQLNGVTLEGNKTLDQVGVLAKNQGSNNSGKFLSVGSDGNVVPADAPSGGGGTGGTTDYNDLTNRPQLNGVTLEGNKTLDQIGAVQKNQGSGNSGKFLSVGNDGNVTLSDAPSGGTVDPEQIKQAVNGYLEENPVSGMTAEQEQQLNQNTTDVAGLKSAINEKWTDISPGEIFEISTNGNDNVYKLEGLAAYFDFTKYPDGYSGDVEDLSGNNTEIMFSGLDLYESGRNGFVNGKLMINNGPLSNIGGSKVTIKSEAIHTYPFSVEIYAHLRRDYNPYVGSGVLNYTSTDALQNYQATVFSTQYNTTDGTGTTNGLKAYANKEQIGISGSANIPNILENAIGFDIDGVENENISDRYDHIVVCFDSNKQKFYLNNELIIDKEETSVGLSMSSILRIFPDLLKGDIKLIRIYNDMLSDSDVEMNYSNALGDGDIENEI